MLKYLIIPLADSAVSFCHYDKGNSSSLIEQETLEKAIRWAMKENLNIQFLYPDFQIPDDYKRLIDTIDHTSIASASCKDEQTIEDAEIIVFDNWENTDSYPFDPRKSYVIRTDKDAFFNNYGLLKSILKRVFRLVVVLKNPHDFSDRDFKKYEQILTEFIPCMVEEYKVGHPVQFNLLTDRLLLEKMNNCNAGDETLTLAPDGNFYICPAFYFDNNEAIGKFNDGPNIKNPQLYRLDHAPICRKCDAWQCRRCVWLNKKLTLEVNTPSHEQCVIAHIERNASRKLLEEIRKIGEFMPDADIPSIDYMDPFEKLQSAL